MGNAALPCPHRAVGGAATALKDPECGSTGGVQLVVTPQLWIPWSRLWTQACRQRLRALAREEGGGGILDEGAVFPFQGDACVLSRGHPHGFIAAATAAFANHYPLSVRPQHFWIMILQAIAVHVQLNAEEVRKRWVAHEGRRELVVNRDAFTWGGANDWASVIDGTPDSVSAQIDEHLVGGVAEELLPAFSDTTGCEAIAMRITVMDACKSFFSYKCRTRCGFPSVTMEGSLQDWRLLRSNAELLICHRCASDFSETWCAALLPLLDIFVEEYQHGHSGERPADGSFWNSMCKRGGHKGSGERTWFNGWLNILFPYINRKPNSYMVPYSSSNGYAQEGRVERTYPSFFMPEGVQGPDQADFPSGLASAPVTWDYLGTEVPLVCKAGFVGATQDRGTGTVRPLVGWFLARGGDAMPPRPAGRQP